MKFNFPLVNWSRMIGIWWNAWLQPHSSHIRLSKTGIEYVNGPSSFLSKFIKRGLEEVLGLWRREERQLVKSTSGKVALTKEKATRKQEQSAVQILRPETRRGIFHYILVWPPNFDLKSKK